MRKFKGGTYMLKSKEFIEEINKYLSILKNNIEIQNANGFFDINKYCENFFCELLNIIYDLQLEDLNRIKVNYPAVDLGDISEGVCFQITSENSRKKIQETVEKFIEHDLHEEYDNLYVLILGNKKNYKTEIDTAEKIIFKIKKNVIDLADLSKEISAFKKSKLEKIKNYLQENIDIQSGQPSYLSNVLNEKAKYTGKCKKYLKHYDIDSKKEAESIIKHIGKFVGRLESFDKNTREIIYGLIKSRVSLDDSGVQFDEVKLKKYLRVDQSKINEELRILLDANFITTADDSGKDHHTLNYWTEDGWEMFYDLIRYCDKEKQSIETMLVDLDFSILD